MRRAPQQLPSQLPPERIQPNGKNYQKRNGPADLPEIGFGAPAFRHAVEVHAPVGGEEGEREEDDGYGGEDEDGFVLAVGYDSEFVLFDGAELEELGLVLVGMVRGFLGRRANGIHG